jgi:hypothetical protein
MKHSRTYLAVGVFALVAGLAACYPQASGPTAPSSINISNTNTNIQGGGGPGASPSPSAVIARVKVVQFGEECPTGKGPATWTQGGSPIVHVGCKAPITCTPKDAAGNDIPATIHGPAPDSFGLVAGGDAVTVTSPSEPFNRDVLGKAPGIATFACTVKGVASGTWDLPVVQ